MTNNNQLTMAGNRWVTNDRLRTMDNQTLPYALGPNALGLISGGCSALLAGSMPVVPSAMEIV
jgi:hypothetical protein